ncbi:MAG TPA: DNA methyltransferase [Jiangellaceae bacterium]
MSDVGEAEAGVIYCEDNLSRLSKLPAESVDLIYLDPPFFSNRTYEVIWGAEAEIRSFEDRWEGGIHVYIQWMRDRVMEMRRVLRPTGTIYLHSDHHASHHIKIMLDDVFGSKNFMDEIIWHYQTSSGAPKKRLHRNHDTIFRYAAQDPRVVTWNHPRLPWPESTLKKWQKDEDGRIYRQQHKFGKKYYVDPDGKLGDDVWEITLSSRSKERLGYPTQKPEALLERIIKASTDPGSTVLDPFCGCGTTVAVAERLNRRWIGIDISPTAVRLIQRRLAKVTHGRSKARVVGLPVTEDELRMLKPFEFQNWVIQQFFGTASPRKSGDMGIDGYTFMVHDPIQVKQSERVGRNVIDNFETAMRRINKAEGFIVAFSFTRGAREEVARARWEHQLDIKLLTVEQLLDDRLNEQEPLFPRPGSVTELPLNAPAGKYTPSASELIRSNREAG